MKSYGNLFEKAIDFENLWRTFRRARKGKRSRPDVAAFEYELQPIPRPGLTRPKTAMPRPGW